MLVGLIMGAHACVENEPIEPVPLVSDSLEKIINNMASMPESEKTADLRTLKFKHPLQGVKLVDGKVPGVDIHTSPSGKRYAVGEFTTQKNEDGPTTTKSGVFEIDRGLLDRSYKVSEIDPTILASSLPKPKIRKALEARMKELGPKDLIDVRIRVVDDYKLEHVWQRLEREIGLGNLKTHADYLPARSRIMVDRRAHLKTLKTPIENILVGWKIKYTALNNLNFIHASVPVSRLKALESLPSVHSLSIGHPSKDGASNECPIGGSWLNNWIDGAEVVQGTQIQQFLCNGFDAQPSSGAYRVAVIEHFVGFNRPERLDWANGPSRWLNPIACNYWFCAGASSVDYNWHPTYVNSLLAGDLRQNQETTIVGEKAQTERSGYAPEAEIYGYALRNGSASFELAVNSILNLSNPPVMTSNSWGIDNKGWNALFHDCDGDWDEDEAINAMYEAGIFSVVLAGNDPALGTECDVWVPGSALSAFTVGGTLDDTGGGITAVQSFPLANTSAYGRENGRDVIEITTPGARQLLPSPAVNGVPQWAETVEGTSFAAPTAAAAALNFMDFYESTYSTWIRNPGALFSNMLLMGDRQTVNGKTDTGFDPEYGGGRMLMRMFNSSGMDWPWGYGRQSTCVNNGDEVWFIHNNIPADVDNFIVVAHWHDRRHDASGNTLDDIDLKVEVSNTSGSIIRVKSSNSSKNNKERVHFSMSETNEISHFKIILKGYSVSADNEGCGSNSQKVFISYYWEDNDRDDGDGPGQEILPQ